MKKIYLTNYYLIKDKEAILTSYNLPEILSFIRINGFHEEGIDDGLSFPSMEVSQGLWTFPVTMVDTNGKVTSLSVLDGNYRFGHPEEDKKIKEYLQKKISL